ncbi:MAG: hypothetical protein JOY79_03245 [Acidobacteriaceae bacterium]|nr:hypothetical protein [Acidobacteriaceae bacterium]
MPPKRKATAADADLILKLYDLRREAVMRQARQWVAVSFWPETIDDLVKVLSEFGSQENAYFRQVFGYWEMACALVLNGALDENLFFDTSGEMFFLFAKLRRFLKEFRQKMNAPEALLQIEKFATGTPRGRQRLEMMEKRIADLRARSKAAAG